MQVTDKFIFKNHSRCPGRRLSTWPMTAILCLTALGTLCGQLTFRLAWCREHSIVTATELLQPRDLACGTLFQSSCVILTSPMDCSDDSWRDTFFRKHEHGSLWLLICGAIEKHLLINLTDITAVVTRDYTVLPATCTFIHNWSELHLPLSASHKSSQPFGRYAFSIPLRVGDSVGRGGLVTEVVCLRRSPIPLITGNKVD